MSHKTSLLQLSFSSSEPILRFGSFTLKSGRVSPYFFNFGLFNTGTLLNALSSAFADQIQLQFPNLADSNDESNPQVLFGPAYKGIPLVASIATELARRGIELGYGYNRKEKKDHGEGGNMVGADLKGKRVLIIDDVVTAGKAIGEATQLVREAGAKVVGIVVALDRQEKGNTEKSTVEEVESSLGVKVLAVLTFQDILKFVAASESQNGTLDKMVKYRQQYGVNLD